MALNDGALDSIVARIEAYFGEFLGTRAQLLDAKSKIDSALSSAQSSGSATIGANKFTFAQLQALSAENTDLLNRNQDLQNRIASFKDSVASLEESATSVMETLSPSDEASGYYDTGVVAGDNLGILPVAVPAAYLVATGAVLATTIYLFLSATKSHLNSVAGEVGSNLLIYGGIALLGAWYAHKKGYI